MVRPPAGNRGSKLVDLGFPVVTRVPWEPEARAEPLAWFVEEALSLLSSFEVGVAWSDDRTAAVLRAACDDCWESMKKSQRCAPAVYGSNILSSCRPNSAALTSLMPCMLSNASMALATDDMATTTASS